MQFQLFAALAPGGKETGQTNPDSGYRPMAWISHSTRLGLPASTCSDWCPITHSVTGTPPGVKRCALRSIRIPVSSMRFSW